jgi:hypothetical protein
MIMQNGIDIFGYEKIDVKVFISEQFRLKNFVGIELAVLSLPHVGGNP